jgi:hypothetical protein
MFPSPFRLVLIYEICQNQLFLSGNRFYPKALRFQAKLNEKLFKKMR